MDTSVPVLTIDGPSGSGKGTISRIVAQRLGWHYLDSGALYRAVGIAAGWADIDLSDASALVRCTFDTEIGFRDDARGEPRVIVNGLDATDDVDLVRTGEMHGGHGGCGNLAADGRGARGDALNASNLRGDDGHVCRGEQRVAAAGYVCAGGRDRDASLAEEHAGEGLDLEVGQ